MRSARVAVGWLALGAAAFLGCGGPQDPGEEGEDCYRDADCKPGLVCVPDEGGDRKCSNDLTNLDSQVEGPPAMEPMEPEPMEPVDPMP